MSLRRLAIEGLKHGPTVYVSAALAVGVSVASFYYPLSALCLLAVCASFGWLMSRLWKKRKGHGSFERGRPNDL